MLGVLCVIAASSLITPVLVHLVVPANVSMRVNFFGQLVGALAATAIMLSIDQRKWSAVGLARENARSRPMLVGLCVGAATIGVACAVLFATGLMRFVPAATSASLLGAAVRVTLVLAVAAMYEEVIMRGYLLTVIREFAGARTAVVATSVMFGVLHLMNPGATAGSVTVVMLAGLLLGTARLALNSLYAAWTLHFAWNWVMAVPLHAEVSGVRFESPGYRGVTDGPAWLSGGAWGPEGGLVAAASLAGGLFYFYARHRREESGDRG